MKDVGFGTWEAGESVTLRLESRNNQGKLFERIPKIVSIQFESKKLKRKTSKTQHRIYNGNMKMEKKWVY